MDLDLHFVRQHFPAFNGETQVPGHFFDSAAGSFPCNETIEALVDFYQHTKVQPGNAFPVSQLAQEKMQMSKSRWAQALGVKENEIGFGPSTTQNLYVLANAFRELLKPGDEVVVTNQDHESNTGSIRRAVIAAGATLKEWSVDSESGLLDTDDLMALLNSSTRLVCLPHSSNITGQKNEVKKIADMVHDAGAWLLVDGVSYAPHDIPDVAALGADIYVFSLYKVYSVHQGVLVVRESVLEALPRQGHYFKQDLDVSDMLIPAGPDHAQIAASGGVLDYIETLSAHHNGPTNDLKAACHYVSTLWRNHELELVAPLLDFFRSTQSSRVLGSLQADASRCPLVSFIPSEDTAEDLTYILCDQNMLLSWGHYYSPRLLEATGVDPESGVIRISMAHYNDKQDVEALIDKLAGLV